MRKQQLFLRVAESRESQEKLKTLMEVDYART
jgi:hypothetical protein